MALTVARRVRFGEAMAVSPAGTSAYARLSAPDLINLAAESPDTPAHVGALAILDGATLCDADGRLRLADLRAQISLRLAAVPRLRQVVRPAGPLAGRPVWVDDPAWRIDRHIDAVVAPPSEDRDCEPLGPRGLEDRGGEPLGPDEALLRLTARLLQEPMDRAHPLWRMWFVTGLQHARIALVIVIHHVLADGSATVGMLRALLDDPSGPRPLSAPGPVPAPTWPAMVRDNLRSRATALAARRHRSTRSRVRGRGMLHGLAAAWHAPRTSLNAPVGPRRRLAVVRLDLAEAKRVAHADGGTVNDLVLDLAAGGLRALLRTRGEPVAGLCLHAAVAVSLRAPEEPDSAGNLTGAIFVRLPVYEPAPDVRLRLVAAETARTKRDQSAAGATAALIWMSRLGLLRCLGRRQHMTNVHESNVVGPPTPIRLFGAPVLDLVPVSMLYGNVGLAFLAFSYAGRLSITVLADADRCPELPVMVAAMRRDWQELAARRPDTAYVSD